MRCSLLIGLTCVATALGSGVDFNRDILPVLSDKCLFCHGPDEEKREADLRLDIREIAVEAGAIAPGEPDESFLVERIHSTDRDEIMSPPKSRLSLSENEKRLLTQWIQEGANYEQHWSFKPLNLEYTAPKSDADRKWVRNGIDAVAWTELKERGLMPQKEATKTQLLRRVYFDLIGLPPTPEEVRAFLAGDSEDAYENVVDQLLNRPEYGERMAVHWLDLARYADTYGHQVDQDRTVWAWRDWVIEAFNENLPYDKFVTYQLAGDLLPNPTQEQRLATAFNRLHQQKSEGGSVEEEFRVEYIDDRVTTFGTAFLGLTLECAKCHDHKYDPITQKEFYQLFAFFDDIDEAGLYSFFTESVPTPALELRDADTDREINRLENKMSELEAALIAERQKASREQIARWLIESNPDLMENVKSGTVIDLDYDEKEGPNRGRLFDGDVEFETELENVTRHDAFSLSFSMRDPKRADRKVICHCSKAWTDAASRGWELLAIEGRLRFSLIHYWPGNAISMETEEPIPVNEWTDVTVTYDGSSRAEGLGIYVNGIRAKSRILKDGLTKTIGFGDIANKKNPKGIVWGARFRDNGLKDGRIADAIFFDRELEAMEVGALKNPVALERIKKMPVDEWSDEAGAFLRRAYAASHLERTAQIETELQEARVALGKARDNVQEIMTMVELPEPKKAYVLARGNYDDRREEVFADTPEAFLPFSDDWPRNRLGLAKWLTDPKHPLFSRVAVNRFWMLCFGRGLVNTAEDFGLQGERPEYQKLLDYLSIEFMNSGWNIKALMRQIVTSSVYRQSSIGAPELMADDPSNRLLARGPRFRLPAEMIRDNALAASGLLRKKLGGEPARPYDLSEAFVKIDVPMDEGLYRRSLYTYWKRRAPSPLMVAFDGVKRDVCSAKRQVTNTPLQSLALLNSPQFVEAARVAGAKAWREEEGNIERTLQNLGWRFISRELDDKEMAILSAIYKEQESLFKQDAQAAKALTEMGKAETSAMESELPKLAAMTIVAQAPMNFDESVVKR